MDTKQKEVEKLAIASSVDNMIIAESLVDRFCSDLHVNEDHYGNILIAVTEAVNNAIKHGNKEDPSKEVMLSVFDNVNEIEVFVEDQGSGFDFNNLPDPTSPDNLEKENGRGIFLMKALSDSVDFQNNGKLVKLTFSKQ